MVRSWLGRLVGWGWSTLCEELLGFQVLENDNFGGANNSYQPVSSAYCRSTA